MGNYDIQDNTSFFQMLIFLVLDFVLFTSVIHFGDFLFYSFSSCQYVLSITVKHSLF
ncbi:unnamed protein product [Brassica oleracea]|uniref:(rape) hypothetical protein n=1 Tax=Brassica napus TaxID=3708 RepID=A0A816JUG1_BRANA|nr:unnamed protein product [Brassica napus]